MSFRFHDTLSGELREFRPLEEGKVRMYNCGPTVYSTPHVGNLRATLFADVIRRALELGGYEVHQVMNITDVGHLTLDDLDQGEDKLEAAARRERLDAWQIAERYAGQFFEMIEWLNVRPAHEYPKATDHVAEMIEIVEGLVASGHAYVAASGNVYYAVESFPEYGRLSKNSLDDLDAGARVDVLAEKRSPFDFALWKRDEQHQMQWDSPWGRGFPGWHVECSAMARKYLGDELDIHTGGEDNVFPHHECEIAQSEAFTGKTFVRYWLHTRHLLVDGRKMSKSSGTLYTVYDVRERGHSMRALRLLLIGTHYRQNVNFTWKGMEAAEESVRRLDGFVRRVGETEDVADDPEVEVRAQGARAAFVAGLEDDLNVSVALAALHDFRSDVNRRLPLSRADAERVLNTVAWMDEFLGLGLVAEADDGGDERIDALVAQRTEARASRDFATADRIRDELAAEGIVIEDTADGVRWYRE